LEPLFKDFHEQALEDSEVFFSGQQGKFLVYSVKLENA
jgi:hypothetical protein